jgi:hypothetical protein
MEAGRKGAMKGRREGKGREGQQQKKQKKT